MSETGPRVIVGLGNPGPEYAAHRHNVGFRVVERLARELELPAFDDDPVCRMTRGGIDGGGVILLQPQRYMNRSGRALVRWCERTGVRLTGSPPPPPAPEPDSREAAGAAEEFPAPPAAADSLLDPVIRPLIVCDDLALPTGSLRLRASGSSGGQNGLEDVIAALGGEELPRLRLGVAPGFGAVPAEEWADLVLSPFGADEEEAVAEMIERACSALRCWLEMGLEQAASRWNRRVRPPAD